MNTLALTTRIKLKVGCDLTSCTVFSWPLLQQLDSGKYDRCATMPLPDSMQAWEKQHRTARKRAWKADRHGYWFHRIDRSLYLDRIHEINTSKDTRQGRPMTAGYRERPLYPPDIYPCDLHGVHAYGVFTNRDKLVAYLFMYRAGDLALVSQILGHAEHEQDGIMYLLFREALAEEARFGPGICVYNRFDSGTDGLRFLKTRVGFEETEVEWLP